MKIRPARYKDFEGIKEIFSLAFNEEYQRREVDIVRRIQKIQSIYPLVKILSCFPNPYQHMFELHVAESDGRIAGLAQMSSRNHNHTRWHIENIAVHPDFRGKGIAKALLEKVFEYYTQKGALRFTLEVDVDNQPAIQLYEKTGFRKYTTLYYYKMSAKQLAEHRDTTVLSIPPGLQQRSPENADALLALYQEIVPAAIRMVEERQRQDFALNLFSQGKDWLKKTIKRGETFHWVVEDPQHKHLVASLDLLAQYRNLPHVIQLMIHPAYSDMAEPLLRFALNQLAQVALNPVLIGTFEYQQAKREAIKATGFKKLTADFLMVRDSLQVLTLPSLSEAHNLEEGFFNPVTYNQR